MQTRYYALPLDALVAMIEDGIAIGLADREAASVSRARQEERQIEPERLSLEAPLRAATVIADLPNKVRERFSISLKGENTHVIPVMVLDTQEYPGPRMRSPFNLPEGLLDPENLRFGGRLVFSYLETAGLKPRLKYDFDSNIRVYNLVIAIEVSSDTFSPAADVLLGRRKAD